MRTFRRGETVEIYHATELVGSTRGVKISYPDTADVTTKGRFVPAGTTGEVQAGGVMMNADAHLFVDDTIDIRPLARSTYDEYPRDRVVIDSQKYLVIRAEKIKSRGGFIHAWLMTERE